MAELRRKADGARFTVERVDEDREIAGVGKALAGCSVLTPVGGGDPIVVHPDDITRYEAYDPATAPPPVDFAVVVKMKPGTQPPMFVAHVPLEGDKVAQLGKAAAVEIVVDSLTVRHYRQIEAVYVTTLTEMEQVTSW